jgi:starch phosphorylase
MFDQKIVEGRQVEKPDTWLRHGNPFELERYETNYSIKFGGNVQHHTDPDGNLESFWMDYDEIIAKAYDTPVPGYNTDTVNTLRLWSSRATREFSLKSFDAGDYIGAVQEKNVTETISKVLYPNDNFDEGKELRFKQQYFMVSASIQDIMKRLKNCKDPVEKMAEKVVIQLNDTHPTLAIPELMRILIDEHHLKWEKAWDVVSHTFAYTNHTILPEAIEKWPIYLFENFLPRHLDIIYEINKRYMDELIYRFPGDFDRFTRMSIIEEGKEKKINMAHLAMVGSFSINGVAELHSKLLIETIFKDFYEFYPEKFNNKTNGVTPRRWIKKSNPEMSDLITSKIGDSWITSLDELKKTEQYANNPSFLAEWIKIKQLNKDKLAKIIFEKCDVKVNNSSMFDVQVKRIHEYKRQLLNVLHAIHLYHRIKDNPNGGHVPRTIIFGGKAAPGYHMAKLIIQLINCVASVVNRDPATRNLLKIAFIPNYNVSLAERIMPGTDLSEQISTAGYEASGTGNMKFALNGALTIGTLDGANVEMMEEVGEENIFIFGNKVHEIKDLRDRGYDPRSFYNEDNDLKRIVDEISRGVFSPYDRNLFQPIIDELLNRGDRFFLMADFRHYVEMQKQVSTLYAKPNEWHHKGILNMARMGKFSSDRTIEQYASEIWNVKPCPKE